MRRIHWNIAWQPPHTEVPKIPERCWTYDMRHLRGFALHAARVNVLRRPAMDYYVRVILLGSDLAFAVALTVATVWIWLLVVLRDEPWAWLPFQSCFAVLWPYLQWFALWAIAMAILYGVADISEDVKLAAILKHADKLDRANIAAANMLTRIKLVTVFLSIVGAGLFIVVSVIQAMIEALARRRTGRRGSDPAPASTMGAA